MGRILGLSLGFLNGYVIDNFKQLTSVSKSVKERKLAGYAKDLPKRMKVGIATGILALSTLATYGISNAFDDNYKGFVNPQEIFQTLFNEE